MPLDSVPALLPSPDCMYQPSNTEGNAVSVTGGIGVLIEDSSFSGTNGTNPQMGIDIEPNSIFSLVQNITVRRCYSSNNTGGGFNLSPDSASDAGHPAGPILFERCVSDHDGLAAFSVLRNRNVSGWVGNPFLLMLAFSRLGQSGGACVLQNRSQSAGSSVPPFERMLTCSVLPTSMDTGHLRLHSRTAPRSHQRDPEYS
jgi:hypothetical protein